MIHAVKSDIRVTGPMLTGKDGAVRIINAENICLIIIQDLSFFYGFRHYGFGFHFTVFML